MCVVCAFLSVDLAGSVIIKWLLLRHIIPTATAVTTFFAHIMKSIILNIIYLHLFFFFPLSSFLSLLLSDDSSYSLLPPVTSSSPPLSSYSLRTLVVSMQAQALRYAFLAEREAAHIDTTHRSNRITPHRTYMTPASVPRSSTTHGVDDTLLPIAVVGVVGSGVMGSGIAASLLMGRYIS